MDNPLMHYEFPHEPPQLDPDGTIDLNKKIAAVVEDAADVTIVAAVLAAARAEEVTDLYLIDKKFIMDAIREKQEREKPLLMEAMLQMDDEPVWVVPADIKYSDYGGWCFMDSGAAFPFKFDCFWWSMKDYGKTWTAYRHKPMEVEKCPTEN